MNKPSRYDDAERCRAVVWRRDTLRRTGRGRNGFEMHYTECRCTRKASWDGLCGQHAAIKHSGRQVVTREE